MPRLKSILRGTNPEVFKQLLDYYIPPPATIWDCTAGYHHFWENVLTDNHTLTQVLARDGETVVDRSRTDMGLMPFFTAKSEITAQELAEDLMPGSFHTYRHAESYRVIFSDRRRLKKPPVDVQADYRLLPIRERWADCIVFDPPYVKITLKTKGMESYLKGDRYATDDGDIEEKYLKDWAITAYESLRLGGFAIVKLQDTVQNWHYKMYDNRYKFDLEATYIHDLGQNWAENVEVKNARKPIPMHAIWMVFKK